MHSTPLLIGRRVGGGGKRTLRSMGGKAEEVEHFFSPPFSRSLHFQLSILEKHPSFLTGCKRRLPQIFCSSATGNGNVHKNKHGWKWNVRLAEATLWEKTGLEAHLQKMKVPNGRESAVFTAIDDSARNISTLRRTGRKLR